MRMSLRNGFLAKAARAGIAFLRRSVRFCSLIALTCAGCHSVRTNESFLPEHSEYSEIEIRSRSWQDRNGQRMQLLNWSELSSNGRNSIVVAQYGNAETRAISWLDFYEVRRYGAEKMSAAPSLVPATDSVVGAFTNMPARTMFTLLLHDYMPARVTSVTPEKEGDRLVIVITREGPSVRGGPPQGFRYLLVYQSGRGIKRNPSVEVWPIGAMGSAQ